MAEENENAENTEETQVSQEGTQEEPQTVPKERFDAVTAEAASLKEANAVLQTNVALLNANKQQQQPAAEPFDIYKHVGLDPDNPDDIPNQQQLKEINKYNQGLLQNEAKQLRFQMDHQDYSELVGTVEQIRSGQFQEPFREALKDPALLAMFQNSQTPQITAYVIAQLHQKNAEKGKTTTKTEAKAAIDEAVEAANRIKTSSNTKGGEALSDAGRYENMSDEEFAVIAAKNGAVV